MLESNCCGAPELIEDSGVCGECKEHSEFEWIEVDYWANIPKYFNNKKE